MHRAFVIGTCLMMTAIVRADPPARPPEPPAPDPAAIGGHPEPLPPAPADPAASHDALPIVGFEVRGNSKLQPVTVGYLAHVAVGDPVREADIPELERALLSSELFTTVRVTLEPAGGDPSPGAIVVLTAEDKHSWIAAPTAFLLPGNLAFGVGFAENNFRGLDQKFLVYGQYGTRTSLFFGTFLDPSYHGSKLTWRTDLYAFRRLLDEYVNPPDDRQSFAVARTTEVTYLGFGALIGWNFLWWLNADLRLRGAYVTFRDSVDGNGMPVPKPQQDGLDFTLQGHITIDHRHHRYGVTEGSYAQLDLEPSIPGVGYEYELFMLRGYHSWAFFGEHELELRGHFNAGRHLPLHEEVTLGGVTDLRGYDVDQFRGDVRAVFRAEYSIPVYKWRFLAFRALGFYDTGYVGFFNRRSDRDYLPNQLGDGYIRNDVGGGLRVYVNNVVLPLLGLDLGYGIEGHSPEIYFEVGLTDF